MKGAAKEAEAARRAQTMPGVGPITALAIETFAPDLNCFRRGRDFTAWLGLVPRQNSTGGKPRLGKTSNPLGTMLRMTLTGNGPVTNTTMSIGNSWMMAVSGSWQSYMNVSIMQRGWVRLQKGIKSNDIRCSLWWGSVVVNDFSSSSIPKWDAN
jgi:hypothetical protein